MSTKTKKATKVTKSAAKKRSARWEAEAANIKGRIETVWKDGEHAVESMWHQSAIAALDWISAHRTRVDALRKSVKGTPIEKALDAALKALRVEARAPVAAKKKTKRPAAAKSAAKKMKKAAPVKRGPARKSTARRRAG